ncbi:MAG: hypothetical protein A2V65_06040 [Deltaproteobacteria bacterium RBG_13_49_15]|nr:MAG: hypothetical protein A2V65_06040 [Deltaproteobacteria bacterium RBG_13_49_15]
MTKKSKTRLRLRLPPILSLSLLFIFVFLSCSSFQKTTRKIGQDLTGSDIEKRFLILPFENKTLLEKEKHQDFFQQQFIDQMKKKCPNTIIETTEGGLKHPDIPLPPSASGRDFFSLSAFARQVGYNAVAIGRFVDVSATIEKRGVLWFKGDRYLLKAHIEALVIDTETGAKILDEDFFHEVEIDENEFNLIRSGKGADLPQIKLTLLTISAEMGKMICEAVDILPWFGYVTSIQHDKLILSSGKKVGLKAGTVMDAFEKGKLVEGSGGQQFILPGRKIGQVKVLTVYPDRSEAVVVSGGPVEAGSIIKFW